MSYQRPSKRRFALPLPRLPIVRVLGKPLILRLLLLLLVIEAIFLAESFTTLMEHALRYGGTARDVLHLLSFKTPEILDLALAISLLIATYFATQDARNRGELVILATAGIHWARVIAFVLALGIFGGALSFLNAGLILPMAKFGERLALADLQKNHVLSRIQNGSPQTTVQTIRDTTFIASPPRAATQTRGQLFVFQPNVTGNWRLALSQDWQVTDPAPADTHTITLQSLSVLEAPYPNDQIKPLNRFTTTQASFAFQMSDALPAPSHIRTTAEQLLDLNTNEPAQLTRLFTRALMVPMAGLLALAALVVGGAGPWRHAALPLAALLMMSCDVASRALLAQWSILIPTPAILLLATLLYLGPPFAYLLWRGEALMTPQRGRT
ncbi:LptF/LptG family permease [Shimia sagamensis]|uniref:Predicted permease YjgP/YjgQ family protein n=1 Tax=Shimia sagamensis TaxID=1566352 RepID=A0ABY1N8N6_9RHOB|nr:LptF/LptG family permease [Shimia sagamensis]SMP03504.1 Predicted permease YjgP/YjgQ family protein [Shimia sagamensis]